MRVKFENYEKCYPKRLKKYFRSNINFQTYDKFIPNMKRAVVGNIPPEIIKLFPKETRKKDIIAFQNVLGDITKYLRAGYKKLKFEPGFSLEDENYRQSHFVKDWAQSANAVLNSCLKRLSISDDIKAELSYVNQGGFGNVFKLSFKNKDGNKIVHDKALKVYYNVKEPYKIFSRIHGSYAESNFWTFLKYNAGHKLDNTQFTKHYISDLKHGYTLTEFIDEKIPETTSILKLFSVFNVFSDDLKYNTLIGNKCYDAGGMKKTFNFINDKVILRYYKKLKFRSAKELPQVMANFEALVENPKTPHRNKIQKAIELFKQQQYIDEPILQNLKRNNCYNW